MSIYLLAAKEILIRFGKPMHYTVLTFAAIDLGILATDSKYPEIAMCSALSRDIINNPVSVFKKKKEGVYDIVFGERIGSLLLGYNLVGYRITRIKEIYNLHSEEFCLKKSLSLFRKLLSIQASHFKLIISNGNEKFIFNKAFLESKIAKFDVQKNNKIDLSSSYKIIPFYREMCSALNIIRNELSYCSLEETLDLCIKLLEYCLDLQNDGFLYLEYNSVCEKLRIVNPN